jgi:D-hexose-6-phosphate mutarotase
MSSITLTLTNENNIWSNQFTINYKITLLNSIENGKEQLKLDLEILNQNLFNPFEFNFAFHSYFSTHDVENTSFSTLNGIYLLF